MAKGHISSCISVCQLWFLSSVFGCSCVAWMTTTYVSRSWYLMCSRTKLWWPLCVSEPVQMHAFLVYFPKIWSCTLFMLSSCIRVAVMTRTYISRCWDLIVQGPNLMSYVRVWASAPLFCVKGTSLFVVHGVFEFPSTPNLGSVMFSWFTCGVC